MDSDDNVDVGNIAEPTTVAAENITPPMNVPTPILVEDWPTESHSFGQVTAVAIDPHGNPVIFHRADRYWDAK